MYIQALCYYPYPVPNCNRQNEAQRKQVCVSPSIGVKSITWNSIWIGGLFHDFFSPMVEINSTSALIVASVCPGNFLIL